LRKVGGKTLEPSIAEFTSLIPDVKTGDNVVVSGIKSGSTVTAKHVLDGR